MLLWIWGIAAAGREAGTLGIGLFSSALTDPSTGLPQGWVPMTFRKIRRHTIYELVEDQDVRVLRAKSDSSSSGLLHKVSVDPQAYPILKWRWKIMNIYRKGDARKKRGDDYPARIYVLFEADPKALGPIDRLKYETARIVYGDYPPIGCLTYIWANRMGKGTLLPNPFTNRAKMIAVASGNDKLGEWIQEKRNIYEDYKTAFGEAPPRVNGVAIMTDSDNTGESAITYYGDIYLSRQ